MMKHDISMTKFEDGFDIDVDTIDVGVDLEDEVSRRWLWKMKCYPEYDDEYLDEESSEQPDEESVEYGWRISRIWWPSRMFKQTEVPEEVILDIYNSFVGWYSSTRIG